MILSGSSGSYIKVCSDLQNTTRVKSEHAIISIIKRWDIEANMAITFLRVRTDKWFCRYSTCRITAQRFL